MIGQHSGQRRVGQIGHGRAIGIAAVQCRLQLVQGGAPGGCAGDGFGRGLDGCNPGLGFSKFGVDGGGRFGQHGVRDSTRFQRVDLGLQGGQAGWVDRANGRGVGSQGRHGLVKRVQSGDQQGRVRLGGGRGNGSLNCGKAVCQRRVNGLRRCFGKLGDGGLQSPDLTRLRIKLALEGRRVCPRPIAGQGQGCGKADTGCQNPTDDHRHERAPALGGRGRRGGRHWNLCRLGSKRVRGIGHDMSFLGFGAQAAPIP